MLVAESWRVANRELLEALRLHLREHDLVAVHTSRRALVLDAHPYYLYFWTSAEYVYLKVETYKVPYRHEVQKYLLSDPACFQNLGEYVLEVVRGSRYEPGGG